MTDEQYYAHRWLSRMWDENVEVEQLKGRQEEIIGSMSGIGKYDSENIPAQTGENGSESKLIEFSLVSEQLEKKLHRISFENSRTLQIIDKVNSSMLRGMLIARYLRRMSWTDVGKLYNYEKTQTYEKYRIEALSAVYPFIPKGEVADE